VLKMKTRGFLEFYPTLRNGAITFVNVLSTDPSVMSGLDAAIKSDRVVLSLGGRRYHIDRDATDHLGSRIEEDDVATDALVYSRTPNGYIAMRATRLEIRGAALFTADMPVSIAVRKGAVLTVGYSAHERTQLVIALPDSPERISLDGKLFDGWSFAPETGLAVGLPAGRGVLQIR